MKRIFTKALCLVCVGALALSLAACGGKADSAASSTASSSTLGSAADYDYQNFNYSDGLDEKGYWEGIRALDYVTLPEDFASVYDFVYSDSSIVARYTPPQGKESGQLSYVAEPCKGVTLIALATCCNSADNTSDNDNEHETRGEMSPELVAWATEQIKAA